MELLHLSVKMPASSPESSFCVGGRVQSSEILGLGCCHILSLLQHFHHVASAPNMPTSQCL